MQPRQRIFTAVVDGGFRARPALSQGIGTVRCAPDSGLAEPVQW